MVLERDARFLLNFREVGGLSLWPSVGTGAESYCRSKIIEAIEHVRLNVMARISQDHESELNFCSVEVLVLPEDFELIPDT
jgi:hypothetical protein